MWFQVKVNGHPVHVYKADAGIERDRVGVPADQQLRELEKKWNEKRGTTRTSTRTIIR